MAGNAVWCNIFIFTFLNSVIKTRIAVNGINDGFLQASNEVQYISVSKEFSSTSRVRMSAVPALVEDSMLLKFVPPLLDFKQRHLGIPHHEKVTLFNVDSNRTIHMSSISGSTVHFHSSFFDDKVLPPLGSTTFNVVFLGREEGEIESNLFIHTSEGSFRYQVRGASVSSPYRLRPLVGVRLPLNSTYCPLIHVYNPFPLPLQVMEAYSSGGDFHLELPSGGLEAPLHLWEIPPFHTRPVIKIRFMALAHKNHTAYVRLRVSRSEEALVVPLEVQVGPRPGLYSHDDLLDFGFGGSCDQPRQLRLLLYNSGSKPTRIQSIVAKPASKALKIDFQPIKVPPDSKLPTRVAVLTFDWAASVDAGQVAGRILVKGKQGQHKLVLPYVARPLHGCLSFDASLTQFCSDDEHARAPRHFSVTNNFDVPLAVVNVSLHRDALPFFKVEDFSPKVLDPGQSGTLFQLSLDSSVSVAKLKMETNLWLHTNVSRVFVPLLCYDGHLDLVGGPVRDLGLLGEGNGAVHHIALANRNPVGVQLLHWSVNDTWANVQLLGCAPGNASLALASYHVHNLTNTTLLAPGHYAVLEVQVAAPMRDGVFQAFVHITTQFEQLWVTLGVQVARGALHVVPNPLLFFDCYPGKVCEQQLQVRSRFSQDMALHSVQSVPPDPRLQFLPVPSATVASFATSTLGRLLFDCRHSHSYLGTSHNFSGSGQWLQTLGLPLHTPDLDAALFSGQHRLFQRSPHTLQLSLQLDTTAVRKHIFEAEVQLTWPLLANWSRTRGGAMQFPLTQVGNVSHAGLTIHNPSDQPVVVQLVLDWAYPRADNALLSLAPWLHGCEANCSGERFSWVRHGAGRVSHELQGVLSHKDSITVLLRPGTFTHTTIAFSPLVTGHHSATLFIRNNLTVLEVLRLSAEAATPLFKFGNRKPVTGTPLLFELTDKHLKDCAREKKQLNSSPNLTVKRSFTARNYGDLPLFVSGFSIDGLPCEGYGFKIVNCEGFMLLPNQTRKVDIAFTPDFTLARVQHSLTVDTNVGSPVNYTLLATLPPPLLAACSAVLGRPSWEPLLYYSVVSLVVFSLFCVLAAAYLEADRIVKGVLVSVARERPVHVLDLNKLAQQERLQPPPPHQPTRTARGSVTESDVRSHLVGSAHKCSAKPTQPASLSPLLPAVNKKKLGRKCGEVSETVHNTSALKKGWGMFHVGKSTGAAEHEASCTRKSKQLLDAKCIVGGFKKNKLGTDALACSEEETSSTTTDSSNNDDVDKERSGSLSDRSHKHGLEKAARKDYKDSYEGDCDDDYDYEREGTLRRDLNLQWKSSCRVASAAASAVVRPSPEPRLSMPHCENRSSNLELPYKLKSARSCGRDRNNKTVLKRRCSDKVTISKSGAAGAESRGAPQLRPASCWSDMKASFSDVVARGDSHSYSSAVAPRTTLLADATVQDCSTAASLGPIGSRIPSSPAGKWESTSSSAGVLETAPTHFLQQEPASLILPTLSKPLQSEDQHPAVHADADKLWEEPASQNLVNATSKCEDTSQADLFTESWLASLWDPLCTPARDAPGSVWDNSVDSAWSSHLWSLPSQPRPAVSEDNLDTVDPGLGFSPFHSLSNIWLPGSSDTTWSPPTTRD